MRKLAFLFLLVFVLGCATINNLDKTEKSNRWFSVEMRPSEVIDDGTVFYSVTLKDNENISVQGFIYVIDATPGCKYICI